jgi:hypothetical protein
MLQKNQPASAGSSDNSQKKQIRAELIQEKLKVQEKLDGATRKLKSSQALVTYYKKELLQKDRKKSKYFNVEVGSKADPVKNFCQIIEKAASLALPGKHTTTKAKMMINALSSGMLFGGDGVELLNNLHANYIRHIFKPWKLVKAYDCSSIGAFKTATVKALHGILDEGKAGLFPSTSSVDRTRKMLDDYCLQIISCERKITRHGEVYFIHHERAIRLLLKATGLYEKAQRTQVSLAFTADGAALTKSRTHVSCGIKITDPDGIHPVSGLPLVASVLGDGDGEGEQSIFNCMQSRELCTILVIADARDSKDLYYDVFRDFFDYAIQIGEHGIPASNDGPKLQPFGISFPQDMKSAQITSKKGGCCKTKKFFCHLCACTSDTLVSFNVGELRCDWCKRRDIEKCYHHDVMESTLTEQLLHDLQDGLASYTEKHQKDIYNVSKESKLRTDPSQVDKETDIHHIEFLIPEGDRAKKNEYIQFIAKECRIRNIQIMGSSVLEWRDALKECVSVERQLHLLTKLKEWHGLGQEQIPLIPYIELLIPCILHLENRVGEKIITMILRKGLDLCTEAGTNYLDRIQSLFQRSILGSEQSPAHWKLRYSKDATGIITIDPIQERNSIVRAMLDAVDEIIIAAIPESHPNLRDDLIRACLKYKSAIHLMTVHRILDDEEQERFQDLIDDYFKIWVAVFGRAGVTNYIHLLGSGHISHFIRKYKCLYIYSQQGWEALNSVCTGFILQNSARGGYGSGEGGGKSYIYPLVRYLMRDLLWKTREADRYFITLEDRN